MRQTGDLNAKVALYRRKPSIVDGVSINDYELLATVSAEVRMQSDKVFAAGDARYSDQLIYVTVRRPNAYMLDVGLRVIWNGRAFNVQEALPDPIRRGFIKLRCVSVQMAGVGINGEDEHAECE